jgi:hypothetical protein
VLSYAFANVEQMQFSKNAYANELAGNCIFTFAAAVRRNALDYDQFYKTIPQAKADMLLKQAGVSRLPSSKALRADAQIMESAEIAPFKRRPKNVVLIMVESLSADYLGSYGNKEN